ncbi:MBL fold metallo-hydrolase [Thiohalomonas denitrificans]|uniref:Glyoxylase, beta-lactamase superfamily II n=1 Tax=Thiohalomonas denitrificans TaxID=415747 RepID=A0A1G5Q7G9_9GAMM|nr:MBL fold metallo-hydrolase [Thiohalomonas denitrificans]SCZ57592.1 Glyoxylase, beta-lactamase superfamily II [Thiohalomonas denitrificans]
MKYRIIPVTSFQQNCSLIWCERTKRAALIDPGGEQERLMSAIRQEGLTLEKVLLTHGHMDHVGVARSLADAAGVPVIGPQREDAFWLQILPQQAEMFGFPHIESFEPDQWLEHGDKVSVGEEQLEVIHCPGHTPGHIVFYHPQTRLAFVGDVLFQGSIGRTDFPRSDHAALLAAIHDRLLPLGDDIEFVPGHGPMSTFGAERRSNPFIR